MVDLPHVQLPAKQAASAEVSADCQCFWEQEFQSCTGHLRGARNGAATGCSTTEQVLSFCACAVNPLFLGTDWK